MEQARAELNDAEKALATVSLESVADATAIFKVVRTNLKQFGELEDWEKAALNNASKFLDRATAGAGSGVDSSPFEPDPLLFGRFPKKEHGD
jgi:hypothetical protein